MLERFNESWPQVLGQWLAPALEAGGVRSEVRLLEATCKRIILIEAV